MHLRKLYFYNCHTCAKYDFTVVRLAQIMILQLLHLNNYISTIIILTPIKVLHLSYMRQLCFYNCYTCTNYNCTIVRLASIMILQSLHLHQLWFFICQIWANYNFTVVIFAPIIILQLLHLRQLYFCNCYTCTN